MNEPAILIGAHVHEWRETETGCEDCGSHPALECVADNCPLDGGWGLGYTIDLVYDDDPRKDPHRP